MSLARRLSTILIPLIPAVLFTLGCGKVEPKKDGSPPAAKQNTGSGEIPAANVKAAFTVTAEALAKECITDAKAAEAKYQGKILEVEGIVDSANQLLSRGGFYLKGAK